MITEEGMKYCNGRIPIDRIGFEILKNGIQINYLNDGVVMKTDFVDTTIKAGDTALTGFIEGFVVFRLKLDEG